MNQRDKASQLHLDIRVEFQITLPLLEKAYESRYLIIVENTLLAEWHIVEVSVSFWRWHDAAILQSRDECGLFNRLGKCGLSLLLRSLYDEALLLARAID